MEGKGLIPFHAHAYTQYELRIHLLPKTRNARNPIHRTVKQVSWADDRFRCVKMIKMIKEFSNRLFFFFLLSPPIVQ